MNPDWSYYLFSLLLLAANVAALAGGFYRLPGNWIILCNVALFGEFFPRKANGLGIGYGTLAVLLVLAIVGESLAYVARHRRKLAAKEKTVGIQGTLTGAGVGAGLGALLGLVVPVIGTFISVLGAMAGAAAGASLGTVVSSKIWVPLPDLTGEESIRSERLNLWLETAARTSTGVLMILTSTSAAIS